MKNFTRTSLFLISVTGIGACSGSGGGAGQNITTGGPNNAAPTPVTTVGRIDGFGSVFVNGIRFDTDQASIRVDDEVASGDGDLSVGMIVRVRGTESADGQARADEIEYDDDIEGDVENLEVDAEDSNLKRFTIFSTSIVASAVDTVFESEDDMPYSFEDLADGDHIEVSGDFDGDTLVASFVEKQDVADEDSELKGTVSDFDGTSFTLTLKNEMAFTVTLAPDAIIPDAGIEDGQFVEVEGSVPDPDNAPTEFLATRVELEMDDEDDDGQDDNMRMLLEGLLNLDGETWSVRETPLSFGDDTEYEPENLEATLADGSAAGRRVKVRGTMADGVLQVDEIEAESDEDITVKGIFESAETDADSGVTTLTVSWPPATGTVTVLVGSETLIKNDDSEDGFDFGALEAGVSFVDVHGFLDPDGNVVAVVFQQRERDEYELEAFLDEDGFDEGVSISVLGIVFGLDADTDIDSVPENGDFVSIEDEDFDGIADSVDIRAID